MLGDLVGKVGRDAAQQMLPTLREMYAPQFVIVNGENSAAGLGITPDIARGLLKSGVDVITLGNHAWNRHEITDYLDQEPRILRPANYPAGTPGARVPRVPVGRRRPRRGRQPAGPPLHGAAGRPVPPGRHHPGVPFWARPR